MNLPTTNPTNGAQPPARSAYASKNAELWRFGEALSRSELIPKTFYNKPANVFLALQIADRMDLDAFAVMSNLFVVHGTPAFSSKFLIGLANLRGPFKGPIKFRTEGRGTPALAVTCYATLRDDGTEVATTVSMKQAQAAGWTKNGKYAEIPEQMLSYRAAAFFVRLYCPEVAIMGARTVDEVEDQYASSDAREVELVERNPLRAELAQTNTAEAQPRAEGRDVRDEVTGRQAAAPGVLERAAPGTPPTTATSALFGDDDDQREDPT